jgi:hypothetical protein
MWILSCVALLAASFILVFCLAYSFILKMEAICSCEMSVDYNLYFSPNIIRMIKSRRMRCAGHVARMGEKTNVYTILMGKLKGKRPLCKQRLRWVDDIKINLRDRMG